MAGIYIHIPFCKQKCHYCNFYSTASQKHYSAFVKALLREIEHRHPYLQGQEINTIYFGGGTPSLLQNDDFYSIQQALQRTFNISKDAEITFEANPDDVNEDFLEGLKTTFVNRLSMGVQSFFSDDLHYLNRVHDGHQALSAIKLAQQAGFDRITIDLIYGIPTLTEEKWLDNLYTFFETGLTHLSAYALTVEPRTALAQLIDKGKYTPVDEVQSTRHFEILLQKMEERGFVHYEISNFALPGHYSRHNSTYWLGGHYLGLGPSAHSFNGLSREWNVSNLAQYVQNSVSNSSVEEKEVLSLVQRVNEYIMTSLRTSWGCDLEHVRNVFGAAYADYLLRATAGDIERGHLYMKEDKLFLTNQGKLFADGIAANLFLEEPL